MAAPEPLSPLVTQKVVRFVYFVEQGERYRETDVEAIRSQAFALQAYWEEQFGGTFYLYDQIVDVILADFDPLYYLDTPTWWAPEDNRWWRLSNIAEEVYRKLELDTANPQTRLVTYPTTRWDGNVGADASGAWMDGDDLSCLHGENSGLNYPYDDNQSAHCLGHVAHELGHVFGLEHEGESDSDCMLYGFYTRDPSDMCDFGDGNRQRVRDRSTNEGWLLAKPGQVVNVAGQVEAW